MHAPSLLFATILASASAINVRLYKNDHCSATYMGCNNLEPRMCCADKTLADVSARSASFSFIPPQWDLTVYGSAGGGCKNDITPVRSKGRTDICLYRGGYSGAVYEFNNAQMSAPAGEMTHWEAMRTERQCVKPDVVGLEDGTEYELSSLGEEDYRVLVSSAMNATTHADIPAQFSNLRKAA